MAFKINATTVIDNSANWAGNSIGTSKITDSAITRAKMGWAQVSNRSNASAVTISGDSYQTIASCSITTNGKPVLLVMSGDSNPNGGSGWGFSRFFRGETALGKEMLIETTNSTNVAIGNVWIDTPSAGTYTFSIRWRTVAGSSITFGETGDIQAPNFCAIELY
jgi:hypothetical protein